MNHHRDGKRSVATKKARELGLSPIEEYVLIQRGEMPWRMFSYAEIALLMAYTGFGTVSRERVEQIQRGALAKLRTDMRRKGLAA